MQFYIYVITATESKPIVDDLLFRLLFATYETKTIHTCKLDDAKK